MRARRSESEGVAEGVGSGRGVLKAPVDCCWSFSKTSWSSFGRRGGEGEGDQEVEREGVVESWRRWRRESVRGSLDREYMVDLLVLWFGNVSLGLDLEMAMDDG